MTTLSGSEKTNGSSERPPRAVVGSQISLDEEMFGAAFDGQVVRRFSSYVYPYRASVYWAVAAVLVFTGAQLSIPLIIRYAIDEAIVSEQASESLLLLAIGVFADLRLAPRDVRAFAACRPFFHG
jgi:ATP-binding cassette subfamily B multidrug efflux pump